MVKTKLHNQQFWIDLRDQLEYALDLVNRGLDREINRKEIAEKLNLQYASLTRREPKNIIKAFGFTEDNLLEYLRHIASPYEKLASAIAHKQTIILLNSDMEKELEQLVHSLLSEKHRDIIIQRFGLNDEPPMTLEELGEKYNCTRERMRQIEATALRKLRYHYITTYLIESNLVLPLDSETIPYETYYNTLQENKELHQMLKYYMDNEGKMKEVVKKESESLETFISRHKLPIGMYKYLTRIRNIKTVGDLVKLNEGQLLSFRSFGRKRVDLIIQALEKDGLSLSNSLSLSK